MELPWAWCSQWSERGVQLIWLAKVSWFWILKYLLLTAIFLSCELTASLRTRIWSGTLPGNFQNSVWLLFVPQDCRGGNASSGTRSSEISVTQAQCERYWAQVTTSFSIEINSYHFYCSLCEFSKFSRAVNQMPKGARKYKPKIKLEEDCDKCGGQRQGTNWQVGWNVTKLCCCWQMLFADRNVCCARGATTPPACPRTSPPWTSSSAQPAIK